MTDQDLPLAFEGGPERPPAVAHVSMPILDEMNFTRREDGGYDPDEVDSFLKDMQTVLDAADNERTALRSDVASLRDRLGERGHQEIAVDAVGLLSQAQLIADRAIADAETYARDLMLAARSQYRIVLERAEESAKRAADQAAGGLERHPMGLRVKTIAAGAARGGRDKAGGLIIAHLLDTDLPGPRQVTGAQIMINHHVKSSSAH